MSFMVFVNLNMAKYRNHKVLKAIGAKIKKERSNQNLEIADISDQTGLNYNTIVNIEKGQDTLISSFIEVCFALNLHPKEILEIELNVKARYKPSPSRTEKSRLTARIKELMKQGCFKSWQGTNDTVRILYDNFGLDVESKNVSSILKRMSKENHLRVKKEGRKNLYKELK